MKLIIDFDNDTTEAVVSMYKLMGKKEDCELLDEVLRLTKNKTTEITNDMLMELFDKDEVSKLKAVLVSAVIMHEINQMEKKHYDRG